MSDVAIFIDLDNTLVDTEIDHDNKIRGPGWQHFISTQGEATYRSTLRPYAEEFLAALQEDYPLYLLTAGMREFQAKVLEYHGITQYFTEIFGRENISEAISWAKPLVPGIKPILVDDLHPGCDGFVRKFTACGIDSDMNRYDVSYDQKRAAAEAIAQKYYVMVSLFTRNRRNMDRELVRVYPEILVKAARLAEEIND